jgi:hypothetical protein
MLVLLRAKSLVFFVAIRDALHELIVGLNQVMTPLGVGVAARQ